MKYNFREKANIYFGGFLGALLPIIAMRYSIYPNIDNTLSSEITSWTSSIIFNVITTLPLYTAVPGLILGKLEASDLRKKREEKARTLETNIDSTHKNNK